MDPHPCQIGLKIEYSDIVGKKLTKLQNLQNSVSSDKKLKEQNFANLAKADPGLAQLSLLYI